MAQNVQEDDRPSDTKLGAAGAGQNERPVQTAQEDDTKSDTKLGAAV